MSFLTYKNTKLLINNIPYYAQNVGISESASIAAGYNSESKYNTNYVAENGIGGSLRVSYLLTGNDPLVNYIANETSEITANFGGLYFNKGYLKSYSFSLDPDIKTLVTAEIVFFDNISGVIIPTYEVAPDLRYLNTANVQLSTIAGNSIGDLGNVVKLNYSYAVDISPAYEVDSTIPSRVVFGPKEIDVDLITDNLDSLIPVSGKRVALRASLVHPENTGIFQNFDCRGLLFKKDFSVANNGILSYQYSVKQNDLSVFGSQSQGGNQQNVPLPIIYFISPTTGYNGTSVTISGKNLSYVDYTFYTSNAIDYNFQIINDSQIQSIVPLDAISGPLTLFSKAGSVTSTQSFIVGGLPISIYQINPMVAGIGSLVTISGNNFYQISRILFNNNQSGAFSVLNKNLIQVTVPNNTSWGNVTVISDLFNVSGTSIDKFVPIGEILNFIPASGFSGDFINLSGFGFSGITGVRVNNLPAGNNSTAFTVVDNNNISVQIPSGNTKGFFTLYGQSGITVSSNDIFYPYVLITGISPQSGRVGTMLDVSGKNFMPELMYNWGSNKYAVGFNGGVTGYFALKNPTTISGAVPSGARSGLVYISSTSLDKYPSSFSFIVRNQPPIISYLNPISGKSGDLISIFGSDLTNILSLVLTGVNTGYNFPLNSIGNSLTNNYINVPLPSLSGNRYDFIINTIEGYSTGSGLYMLDKPFVSGFSPISGGAGTVVNLTGLNIYPFLTQIWIDNSGYRVDPSTGSWNYNNNNVSFTIPNIISSGKHSIVVYNTVSSGSGNIPFTFIPFPIISGFYPLSGQWGDIVKVTGLYFDLINNISIANLSITSYSIINSTGLSFTIPISAQTDYISLSNNVGTIKSSQVLTVVPPLVVITGFTPTEGYYGTGIIVSGNYLNTIKEVHFSGIGSGYVKVNSFTGINNTGLYFSAPGNIVSERIRFVNDRGQTYSTQIFSVISGVSAILMSPSTGVFKDTILISGNFLSGSVVYFTAPNTSLVAADNIISVSGTGLYFNIPSGVSSRSIVIQGRNGRTFSPTGQLIVLPTISGVSGSLSYATGTYITISGINADELSGVLGISGNNLGIYNIANINEFTGDYQTGYDTVRVRINDNFAGTGKIFLGSFYDTTLGQISGSLTNGLLSKVLFNTPITISQPSPIITSFTPTGGANNALITINGYHLLSTNNIIFNVGANFSFGTINSISNTKVTVYPPFMASGTGLIYLTTPFGTTSTGVFKLDPRLYISGYVPLVGHTGDYIRISGSGLQSVTGVMFGVYNANFVGVGELGTYIISGIVPTNYNCCPNTVQICVINEGESYCL
jgi:hypothetical protein